MKNVKIGYSKNQFADFYSDGKK